MGLRSGQYSYEEKIGEYVILENSSNRRVINCVQHWLKSDEI